MAVITLDVVSATVKRDKVRRMVVKGITTKREDSSKEEAMDETPKPNDSDEIESNHSEMASEPEPVVVFL